MSNISERMMTLLTIAAELRAAGASWARIGEACKRDAESCRHWPRTYREVWIRLYREAEDQTVADAGMEARNALRKMNALQG